MPPCSCRAARAHDLVGVGEPERDEEEPRLVDVPVVLVHDRDLGLVAAVELAEAVRHQRAARAATEDHDLLPHALKCRSGMGRLHPGEGATEISNNYVCYTILELYSDHIEPGGTP